FHAVSHDLLRQSPVASANQFRASGTLVACQRLRRRSLGLIDDITAFRWIGGFMRIVNRLHVLTAATALVAAAGLVGCQQSSGVGHPTTPAAAPRAEIAPSEEAYTAAATVPPAAAAPAAAAAMTNRMYFPTGDESSSVLLLEKTGPAQVRVGK